MLIALKPFLVPRGTSHFLAVPAYEKPLLQVTYNTNGDRATWVKELTEFPAGFPPNSKAKELNAEGEMSRLAARYGFETFRKVYPIDDIFLKAFEACQTVTLPSAGGEVPDAEQTVGMLIEDIMKLNVPAMKPEQAAKLVDAGHTIDSLPHVDAKSLASKTGLNLNMIRSTIEAAKLQAAADAPPRAPSAPTQFKATILEPVPTT
jgi:hypothetical protein